MNKENIGSLLRYFKRPEWAAVLISILAFLTAFADVFYAHIYTNNSLMINPIMLERNFPQIDNEDQSQAQHESGLPSIIGRLLIVIVNNGNSDQFLSGVNLSCGVEEFNIPKPEVHTFEPKKRYLQTIAIQASDVPSTNLSECEVALELFFIATDAGIFKVNIPVNFEATETITDINKDKVFKAMSGYRLLDQNQHGSVLIEIGSGSK
jgi:hypothetical protein